MNISNKALVLFLVMSIFVSIFGVSMSIYKLNTIKPVPILQGKSPTGFATNDTGNVTLNIAKTASIKFVNSSCDWGSGSPGTNIGDYCLLETNGSGWVNNTAGGCVGFNTVSQCLVLENNGTARVSLDLNFSQNATALLGGNSGALLQYWVVENETNSCGTAGANLTEGSWNDTTIAYEPIVCTDFSYFGSSNTLLIDFRVGFNSTISQGQKLLNLTAYATSIE